MTEESKDRFDHVTAWHQAAAPAWRALPQHMRELAMLAGLALENTRQRQDCTMGWPSEEELSIALPGVSLDSLKARFASVPSELLAEAAAVAQPFGHWRPGAAEVSKEERTFLESGGYWRFCLLATKVLAQRLEVPDKSNTRGQGVCIFVHEGQVRLGVSRRDFWTWIEAGLATAQNVARVHAAYTAAFPRGEDATMKRQALSDAFDALSTAVKASTPTHDGPLAAVLDAKRFMVSERELRERDEERKWRDLAPKLPHVAVTLMALVALRPLFPDYGAVVGAFREVLARLQWPERKWLDSAREHLGLAVTPASIVDVFLSDAFKSLEQKPTTG